MARNAPSSTVRSSANLVLFVVKQNESADMQRPVRHVPVLLRVIPASYGSHVKARVWLRLLC